MFNVSFNEEKAGIEIRFDSKPDSAVLSVLKENGFRWSGKQKMWYAKQNDERLSIVKGLEGYSSSAISKTEKQQTAKVVYDLWDNTRIANDVDNHNPGLSVKEIAAIIRKHIKERFPMCKWSVTSSNSSIDVSLLESPWVKGSDELNAIVNYVYKFSESYNYCTCYDPYGDYGSSYNFYGVYENNIITYNYVQREMTVAEMNMGKEFLKKKSEFEAAERIREEKEFQERMIQQEKEKAENEKRRIERDNCHEKIESSAIVKEVEYFMLNCDSTDAYKEDKIEGYTEETDGEEIKHCRVNNKVTKEVYLSKELYDMFIHQLMDSFSFLAGMGGTHTDDLRIQSQTDYSMMSKEERKTVEWYNTDCVAIFCNNEMKLVIDPQGYDYARYVFFVDNLSEVVDSYHTSLGISKIESRENRKLSDTLEDASTDIIMNNNLLNVWNTDKFNEYKQLMKEWINNNHFKFNVGVVRAIREENSDFKIAMYKLLTEVDGIQEQFKRSGLSEGQKITIIHIGDFGGIHLTRGKFLSFECASYAQYDSAVKMIYRPENKRSDYYVWFYRDVLIFDGWYELPEELLWETTKSSSGLECKKSRFLSCDDAQYDVILEYFKNNGIKPVINTYKPQF